MNNKMEIGEIPLGEFETCSLTTLNVFDDLDAAEIESVLLVYWSIPRDIDSISYLPIYRILPSLDDIPKEFLNPDCRWRSVVSQLFSKGDNFPRTKEGIDSKHAVWHLMKILTSSKPRHEHKMIGIAWLMSMWFELPEA